MKQLQLDFYYVTRVKTFTNNYFILSIIRFIETPACSDIKQAGVFFLLIQPIVNRRLLSSLVHYT